ncbi:DUF4357 domain-containing protein, partial [bacterium]|nr:DUF4357 domain-containing protein [bacterium]
GSVFDVHGKTVVIVVANLLHNSRSCGYDFSSPSAAAAIVLARSANGWTEWKTKEGSTLKDGEEK